MENPAYQTVYGVGLLDDLHNYFPALLYDQGRFQTLPTLFAYVRHQMNTRFNLYSYGASLAGAGARAPAPAPNPARAPVGTSPAEEDLMASIASANIILSLLQPGLSGLPGFTPASRITTREAQHNSAWAAFRSPVIVAPSQEVLAANTQIIAGSDLPSNTVCSICQDSILTTDSCRRLTVCQHVYHIPCIDQWFRRSVFCPSCRHDIRITSPRLQAAPTPETPLPPLVGPPSSPAPPTPEETLFQALGFQ
jgi:hypothetical protein